MITKSKPASTRYVPGGKIRQLDSTGKLIYENVRGPSTYKSGAEQITYQSGPKYGRARECVWKMCTHTASNARSINPLHTVVRYYDEYYREYREYDSYSWTQINPAYVPKTPGGSFDSTVVADIMSQVDLNTKESVLLYSGILQALPFLGAGLKFGSTLNRIARHISKDMRRKPFTSVIKGLIAADFIDRFVINPMIADARMFVDATNYVLRVIETARSRNSAPTALRAQRVKTLSSEQWSGSTSTNFGLLDWTQTETKTITSKAFAYLDVRYDLSAISPIKLWASRVGLTRPLESAWDLIPFSFVVDYFSRAGEFISGLSDRCVSQEGLVGKVGKIHGFWGTLTRRHGIDGVFTDFRPDRMPGYGDPVSVQKFGEGGSTAESLYFTRFPISDPYYWLSRLEKDDGFIHLNLSPVRARTIAELLIQAKL